MSRTPPPLDVQAHHEAAHAVAAVLRASARTIDYVVIGIVGERCAGRTRFLEGDELSWGEYATRLVGPRRDAEAVVLAAGRYGHEKFLGGGIDEESGNFWCTDDDERLMLLTVSVDRDARRDCADQMAAMDIGDAWLEAARRSAYMLVDENWSLVCRVAAMLLSRSNRLSGAEVRALMSTPAR